MDIHIYFVCISIPASPVIDFVVPQYVTSGNKLHLQCHVTKAFPNFYVTVMSSDTDSEKQTAFGIHQDGGTFSLTVDKTIQLAGVRSRDGKVVYECIVVWMRGVHNETIKMTRTITIKCKHFTVIPS